jgi:hypothetical protein
MLKMNAAYLTTSPLQNLSSTVSVPHSNQAKSASQRAVYIHLADINGKVASKAEVAFRILWQSVGGLIGSAGTEAREKKCSSDFKLDNLRANRYHQWNAHPFAVSQSAHRRSLIYR